MFEQQGGRTMAFEANETGIYLGTFSIDPVLENAETFASHVDGGPALVHTHADWSIPDGSGQLGLATFTEANIELRMSPLALAERLDASGSMPAISWCPLTIDYTDPAYYYGTKKSPVSMQDIIDGEYDSYIRSVAQEVREYGGPLMLALFGEVDAAALFGYGAAGEAYVEMVDDRSGHFGDPTVADGPERAAAVYQRVVELFREEGADNVGWYIYTGSDFMTETGEVGPAAYYPGDDYVDWVGQSVYVTSADDVAGSLDAGYAAWGTVTEKPFLIPELGLEGDGGGDRAGTIADMLAALDDYGRLDAVTWTDFDGAAAIYGVPRLGSTAGEWESLASAPGYVHGDAGTVATDDILEGTAAADLLEGGAGDDVLFGRDGMDDLRGGAGADMLTGGAGVDRLAGGGGDDILVFGDGDDTVSGGAGVDIFLFAADCGLAAVTDFDPDADVLALEHHDAASLAALFARSYDAGSGVLLTVDAAAESRLWLEGVASTELGADNVLL
jgi:hypothetical protein